MKFPKNPDLIRGPVRGALREGNYERKETDAALRVVRAGDVVMELGAGIGYMSTLVATHRDIAHVHAFEANPTLVPYIKSVHAANGINNATVHHAIIGEEAGEIDFYVRKNFLASSMDPDNGGEVLSKERIEVRASKAVTEEIKPTVLICDIEGAEAHVLPMMDLSTLRAAIIELHPQWIGPKGVNAVFQAMMGAGLAYFAKGSTQKVVSFRRDWPLK